MSIESRTDLRQLFLKVWESRETPAQLTPLEQQLLGVIAEHPEYHDLLEKPDSVDQDYRTDNNPFLHLSLHLGLLEQLSTNRPHGICVIYQRLFTKLQDEHQVQHLMMEKMAETLWDAQQNNKRPDERDYFKKLEALYC
jgi:cell fate (sporulation/competence/biofilm development) regulator YlbF (YheA/YmcA/DUF963 family)